MGDEENRKKHPRKNPSPRKRPSDDTGVDFSEIEIKEKPPDIAEEVTVKLDQSLETSYVLCLKGLQPSTSGSVGKHKRKNSSGKKRNKSSKKSKDIGDNNDKSNDREKKKSKSKSSSRKVKKLKFNPENVTEGFINSDLPENNESVVSKSLDKKDKKCSKSKSQSSKSGKKDKKKTDKKKYRDTKENSGKNSGKKHKEHGKKHRDHSKKPKVKKDKTPKSSTANISGNEQNTVFDRKRKQDDIFVDVLSKKVKLEVEDENDSHADEKTADARGIMREKQSPTVTKGAIVTAIASSVIAVSTDLVLPVCSVSGTEEVKPEAIENDSLKMSDIQSNDCSDHGAQSPNDLNYLSQSVSINAEFKSSPCDGSPSTTLENSQHSELDTLTENLLSLNRDSAHLNTIIYRKPTPRKRKRRSNGAKTPSRKTPLKRLTPHKSPWKSFSLRITPHKRSTPCRTPCKTPSSTPGSASTPGSIADLHTPKSTPRSVHSERKYSILKKTPSKVSIKRRLYSVMRSPEKIMDENDDLSNLSFAELTSTSPELELEVKSTERNSPGHLEMTPLSTKERDNESLLDQDLTMTPGLTVVLPDDDPDDMLNIASETEEDRLDTGLEKKSQNLEHVQLTVKNVRSIIHQVITNEQVLDMVRNTLQQDGLEDQLKEAIFEPRMTRSRVKEAMEKGSVPLPWTLSPIKNFKEEKYRMPQHFLEMSFSDNEENDDVDYKPSVEELEHVSDEESVCSQTSDFGSPRSTCTSIISPAPSLTAEFNENSQGSTVSSMAPPVSTFLLGIKHRRNLSGALQKASMEMRPMTEEEVMIAKRTRSKLPLTDTLLEEIESEFIAPDITADMYDTHCDDSEWKDFLSSLTKTVTDLNETNETNDENEDPEYNFLADNEKDKEDDDEDFRSDKAVNIPKKEVNELMCELFEAYGGADILDEDTQDSQQSILASGELTHPVLPEPGTSLQPSQPTKPSMSHAADDGEDTCDGMGGSLCLPYPGHISPLNLNPQLASIVASDIMRIKHHKLEKSPISREDTANSMNTASPKDERLAGSLTGNSIPKLSELEIIQLQDQMRKHVQLLAQTYIQAGTNDHKVLISTQESSKLLLIELKMMGDKSEALHGRSYLKPCNLKGAIQLTDLDLCTQCPEVEDVLEKHMRSKVMTKKAFYQCSLTYRQMEVFVTSPVFLFPQMLPDYVLVGESKYKRRVAFTHAEDNLLAMGVDQFHQLEKRYMFIHKFLLPTKQREQLRFRHKNLKARQQGGTKSAVMFWYENGCLPDFQRYLELEDVDDIKPPMFRDAELLPSWYQAYACTRHEMNPNPSQSIDQDLPITPTSSIASPAPLDDFKKEIQQKHTGRKAKSCKSKETDEELTQIAPRPMLESPITVTKIDCGKKISNLERSMAQQVMDTLMSAIGDGSSNSMTNTVTTSSRSDVPLVTAVATTDQGEEPVVMLTASQLQQLGINLNVVQSPNADNVLNAVPESLPAVSCSPAVTAGHIIHSSTSTLESSVVTKSFSSPCASGVEEASVNRESLISHAFSEATGISLDELNNLNQMSKNLDSATTSNVNFVTEPCPTKAEIEPGKEAGLAYDASVEMTCEDETTIPTLEQLVDGMKHAESDVNDPICASRSPNGASRSHDGDSRSPNGASRSPNGVLDDDEMEGSTAKNANQTEITTLEQLENVKQEKSILRDTARNVDNGEVIQPDAMNAVKNEKQTNESAEPQTEDCKPFLTTSEDGTSTSSVPIDTSPSVSRSTAHGCLSPPQSRYVTKDSVIDESPTKSAIRMMAELAQLISPKGKSSSHLKWPHQHRASFKYLSPSKKSLAKPPLKPLCPLGPIPVSPEKINLPAKSTMGRPPRQSPLKKDLNQQARSIAPKGFVLRSYVSPVKLAAANIAAKARRKNQLKPAVVRKLRVLLPKKGENDDEQNLDNNFEFLDDEDGDYNSFGNNFCSENKMDVDLDCLSGSEAGNDGLTEDEDLEDGGDEDEDRLAELMAASTTVRSIPKLASAGDLKRNKARKRQALLQLLEPDIVGNDPRRDERDTAFAQGYLVKVQHALSGHPVKYENFLRLLYEFGCSDRTPVELYTNMKELLVGHPALLSDFAGFLLPDQAMTCGCLMENINFKKCRDFLRKLEIHFSKQPHALQRVVRAFALWQSCSHPDPDDLMSSVKPLLKGQQHLLDEFMKFFDNERPPDSCRSVFEEVVLGDSDDEDQPVFDGFEEVEFPDGDDDDELYGSKLCRCNCHNSREPKYARRRVHCRSCAIRVVRGQVYLQTTDRDVYILEPSVPPPRSPGDSPVVVSPPHDRNISGDDEPVENIPPPPPALKHRKHKKHKNKLRLKLASAPCVSSRVEKQSNMDSLDAFSDHGLDDVSHDGVNRLTHLTCDESRSASPHVLSCGEDALLSPDTLDGAASRKSQNKPRQVTGPTDFSHLRQEFRQSKDNSGDVGLGENTRQGDVDDNLGTAKEECVTETDAANSEEIETSSNDANSVGSGIESNDSDIDAVTNTADDDAEDDDSDDDLDDILAEDEANDAANDDAAATPDDDDEISQDGEVESEDEPHSDWSRDDDRLILETCKREGTGTATFQSIAVKLGKTSAQVAARFMEMMQLFADDEDGTEASDGEG